MPKEYSVFVCLMASYSQDRVLWLKVCRASNLARNLARHNREEKCYDPSTRIGAPYWEYVMVIGPFTQNHKRLASDWNRAAEIKKEWSMSQKLRFNVHE